MAKRGGFPGMGAMGGMNMNQLMKQAKQMQADIENLKQSLQLKNLRQ